MTNQKGRGIKERCVKKKLKTNIISSNKRATRREREREREHDKDENKILIEENTIFHLTNFKTT